MDPSLAPGARRLLKKHVAVLAGNGKGALVAWQSPST
jgi:hypothetical protein